MFTSIWRVQPSQRLQPSSFIPCDATDSSVNVANDFWQESGGGGGEHKVSGNFQLINTVFDLGM